MFSTCCQQVFEYHYNYHQSLTTDNAIKGSPFFCDCLSVIWIFIFAAKQAEFKNKRKHHYNEAYNIKLAKQLIEQELAELEDDDDSNTASANKDSVKETDSAGKSASEENMQHWRLLKMLCLWKCGGLLTWNLHIMYLINSSIS